MGEGDRKALGKRLKVNSILIPLNMHFGEKKYFSPSDVYAREWTNLLKVTEADY